MIGWLHRRRLERQWRAEHEARAARDRTIALVAATPPLSPDQQTAILDHARLAANLHGQLGAALWLVGGCIPACGCSFHSAAGLALADTAVRELERIGKLVDGTSLEVEQQRALRWAQAARKAAVQVAAESIGRAVLASVDVEPTIATAPGQAPEARYAEIEARNRVLDDLTGNRPCAACGGVRHPDRFEWRGRTRRWHDQLEVGR